MISVETTQLLKDKVALYLFALKHMQISHLSTMTNINIKDANTCKLSVYSFQILVRQMFLICQLLGKPVSQNIIYHLKL